MAVSYQARVVFPVDRPPIEHGLVTVEGTRIVEVGKERGRGEFTDLGSVALFPGLVNAHTHFEFSNLRQPLGTPGMSLPEWIRLVIAERGRGEQSNISTLNLGYSESIARGAITIGDISTSMECPGGDVTSFREVIGFSRARVESALYGARIIIDSLLKWKSSSRSGLGLNLAAQYGISPHAPYSVSPGLLVELVSLSKQRNLPMAMHVAESREELELLRESTGPFKELLDERSMWDAQVIPHGSRPLDYLRVLADAPRALVIHGNYLDEEELAFLGANRERMSLVYCPRTHAYFGHEPYPLERALLAGVRMALGTDSRASSPDLDLLAEMRFVARAYPTLEHSAILRMGTLSAAEALGRDKDVGSITPGKSANLIAVPLPNDLRNGCDAALEAVLMGGSLMSAVWGGRKAVQNPSS